MLQKNTYGAEPVDTRTVTARMSIRHQMCSYLAQINKATYDLNFEVVCLILKAKYDCISSLQCYREKSEVFIFK